MIIVNFNLYTEDTISASLNLGNSKLIDVTDNEDDNEEDR